ncbi:hypothetical protein P4O66_014022 [Electrophorus voltai]|uniref:PPM-type phosphatase domain-containing protein n=1 Tax=Electrophorus voltai TaxID=2609070 RepID=A0AAD9DPN8_9TELE|nr:hypothetical protein P4O66_014022 [Electrophorus voltai]
MIGDTMTLLSLLGRIMRYFLLRPETLFLLCISLALWSYFFHTDEVKTIVKSSRDAVKMVKGKVAEIMQNDKFAGLDVLDAEFSKTWEFKSNNVAVYSIQGRREHMEDRFEVLTDVVNKSHPSIFGIFDGHGGEVGCFVVLVHRLYSTHHQTQPVDCRIKLTACYAAADRSHLNRWNIVLGPLWSRWDLLQRCVRVWPFKAQQSSLTRESCPLGFESQSCWVPSGLSGTGRPGSCSLSWHLGFPCPCESLDNTERPMAQRGTEASGLFDRVPDSVGLCLIGFMERMALRGCDSPRCSVHGFPLGDAGWTQ